MARRAKNQTSLMLSHNNFFCHITRVEGDWKSLLLDVVAAFRREYGVSDTDMVQYIEWYGPEAMEAEAALQSVKSRIGNRGAGIWEEETRGGGDSRLQGGKDREAAKVGKRPAVSKGKNSKATALPRKNGSAVRRPKGGN